MTIPWRSLDECSRASRHTPGHSTFWSEEEDYDVRKFEQDALRILEELFKTKKVVIMTGGSGLFADAVVKGLDEIPDVDPDIRGEIIEEYESRGLEWLQGEVEKSDPEFYAQADRFNPQRLMRALEVFRGTGLKFSSFRIKKKIERSFQTVKIGLNRDREELYQRIDLRMDEMIGRGLFDSLYILMSIHLKVSLIVRITCQH